MTAPLPTAPLPIAEFQGTDPEQLKVDLRQIIEWQMSQHPRTLQKAIGPSELGTPCVRKLAYKLAAPAWTSRSDPGRAWLPTIGVAVHGWLEKALFAFNEAGVLERFMLEHRVVCGVVDDKPVYGTADVYDRISGTVIDWKIVGATTLAKVRRSGLSDIYRAQVNLYARGFVAAGYPVNNVAVCFLPRNGGLHDTQWVAEPYDAELANMTLMRANGIATALRFLGADEVLPKAPTADDYCTSCPFFRPAWSGPLTQGCPGAVTHDTDAFLPKTSQPEGKS